MKTVAFMREYVINFVNGQALIFTGQEIIQGHFGIPFDMDDGMYIINGVPMTETEFWVYIVNFFQEMDTIALIELYNKIKV